MSVEKYASDPTTRRGSMDAAITPPGSTRSRRRPSSSPPWPWKYHHGMPFCVLTTTVSGPSSGATGRERRQAVRLDAENDHVRVADRVQIAGDLRLHLEVAVRADDAQAALLSPECGPAGKEDDVASGFGGLGADVAADGAGAGDDDSHGACCL